MASNSFGKIFRITTWGESHGKAIGVVVDGCPAGLELNEEDINKALFFRSPGRNAYVTARTEPDQAEILSGVFLGKTTGAPISVMIPNKDCDSSKYESTKNLYRPGHANFTYLEKYGVFDYRGGGRASARETACRVAAGAIANKILRENGIEIVAYMKQIGSVETTIEPEDSVAFRTRVRESPVYCPDRDASEMMQEVIVKAKGSGDSLGGLVEFFVSSLPVGLGDPVYDKLEALLAAAFLSIPASKGFEIGSGFRSVAMAGSVHNDPFLQSDGSVRTKTNFAGGTLGGISTGMPLIGRVAFKPPSGIMSVQQTVSLDGDRTDFKLPEGSRHDPCIAIRAVPVVEAMLALVLVDAMLSARCARI